MRIAIVLGGFPLVSETFILEITRRLVERGHDVTIIALRGRAGGHSAYDLQDPAAVAGQIVYVSPPSQGRLMGFITALGSLVMQLCTEPNKTFQLLRSLHWPQDFNQIRLYRDKNLRSLADCRFDIIHAQFATIGRLVLQLRDYGLIKGPLITHIRGHDVTSHVHRYGVSIYHKLFAQGEFFLANCDHFRQQAAALGCPKERVAVFFSGIDLDRFPRSPLRPVDDGPLRIVSVGRLVEKKGFEYAIPAVSALVRRGIKLIYTIVGEGEERAKLEALIASLEADSYIHLVGARPPSAIPDFLSANDIFLGPSITAANGDQDAGTNVLKEAMATGRPVVATYHG